VTLIGQNGRASRWKLEVNKYVDKGTLTKTLQRITRNNESQKEGLIAMCYLELVN